MKKRDLILISVILVIGLLAWGVLELAKEEGAYVTVSINGEEIARYSLSKDGEYELNGGTNILKIENGEAYMVWADCPALGSTRCTHQGRISKTTESIYCEYNNVIVIVYGAEDPDVELVG